MSVGNYIYVGPFLKIKKQFIEKKGEAKKICSKEECSNSKKEISGDFCSKCGSPHKLKSKIVKEEKVNLDDLIIEVQEEALSEIQQNDPQVAFYIPNVDRKPPRNFHFENTDFEIVTDIHKTDEVSWFEKSFEKEIFEIGALLDHKNVEIQWGILIYSY